MVLAWDERYPRENETGRYLEINGRKLGPFYSRGDLSLKNRASWLRYEVDELHDRMARVREVVPPDPPGQQPWWKFWGR